MPSLPCFRFRDWTSHGCPTFRGVVATLASFLLPRVSLCVCVPPPTRYRLESRSRLAASKLLCKPRDTEREREREAHLLLVSCGRCSCSSGLFGSVEMR
jgi:hypothetical protein